MNGGGEVICIFNDQLIQDPGVKGKKTCQAGVADKCYVDLETQPAYWVYMYI